MKKSAFFVILFAFLFTISSAFAGTFTKGLAGKEDISLWYHAGTDSRTYTRPTSTGYSLTLHKIDWVGIDVGQVYGAGVNYTDSEISDALTDIGVTDKRTIWLAPTTWNINDDLTTTSNVMIVCPAGCILNIAAGKTLTINGPFEAGLYQVFSGTGSVAFGRGAITYDYPEWWGAWPSDGVDDTAAIGKAVDAAGSRAIVKFNAGYYNLTSLAVDSLFHIEGVGGANVGNIIADTYNFTTLVFSEPAGTALEFHNAGWGLTNCTMKNIAIDTVTTGTSVYFNHYPLLNLENVFVNVDNDDNGSIALHFHDSWSLDAKRVWVNENDVDRDAGTGIKVTNTAMGGDFSFIECSADGFSNAWLFGEEANPPTGTIQAISLIGCQAASSGLGIGFIGGVEGADVIASYIEGCPAVGAKVAWGAKNVSFIGTFFNQSGANATNLLIGDTAGADVRKAFYNVNVVNNIFHKIGDATGIGIKVETPPASGSEGCWIERNRFEPKTDGFGTGVDLNGATIAQLRDNTFGDPIAGTALATDVSDYSKVLYPNYNHGANVETIVGNKTLTVADARIQILNNNAGGGRVVFLPPEEKSYGKEFIIMESGGVDQLNVQDDAGGGTILLVAPNQLGRFFCDGTTWHVDYNADTTVAAAGADGTISSRSANALGECDGFLVIKGKYVPYWDDITP